MENYKEYRNSLAEKLRAEPDHEKRAQLLKSLLFSNAGYDYYGARAEKAMRNEQKDKRQVLFLNEREKQKVLDSYSRGLKTRAFKPYLPLRLTGTLLDKVFEAIDDELTGIDDRGHHDFYDFFSSVPVGADLSEWARHVADTLEIKAPDDVPLQLGDANEDETFTMAIGPEPLRKDSWANIGGLEFEKKIIPGERVGGIIREARESEIKEEQSHWFSVNSKDIAIVQLKAENVDFETRKNVRLCSASPFAQIVYDNNAEREDIERISTFCRAVNKGEKFRLEIDHERIEPKNPNSVAYWSVQWQEQKNAAGELYTAHFRLENDRKIFCLFPNFLKAAALPIPRLGAVKTKYIENKNLPQAQRESEVQGYGCKIQEVYCMLKAHFGDQFVGIF